MLGTNPLLSLLGMLVLIAAVLFLAWFATKQIAQRPGLQGFGGRLSNRDMRVLAQLPLGSQQRLVVAECGTHYFLLGVTEHQITLLSELSEEEVQQWRQEQEERSVSAGNSSFAALLQNKLRR